MPANGSGLLVGEETRWACGVERRKPELTEGFLLGAFGVSRFPAGFSAGPARRAPDGSGAGRDALTGCASKGAAADEGLEISTVFEGSGAGADSGGAACVFPGGSTFMVAATSADCGERPATVSGPRLRHQYHPPPARAASSIPAATRAITGERRGPPRRPRTGSVSGPASNLRWPANAGAADSSWLCFAMDGARGAGFLVLGKTRGSAIPMAFSSCEAAATLG